MRSTRAFKRVMAVSLSAAAASCWLLGAGTAHAQAAADAAGNGAQAPAALQGRRARMQAEAQRMLQRRLDEAANRLQIRSSQEPAWNSFTGAIRQLAQPPAAAARRPQPNRPQDAAALLHRRADAAMMRAQRLARLADATGKLQAVLDPNQREVLDQLVRSRLGRERGFHRGGFHGRRMRPGVRFAGPRRDGDGPGAASAPDVPPPGPGAAAAAGP